MAEIAKSGARKRAQRKVLFELAERKRHSAERDAKTPRIDNASLPAGSSMIYYCRLCGQWMQLPELHPGPAPRYCFQCDEGIKEGYLNP